MTSNIIDKEDLQEPYIITKDLKLNNISDFTSYYKKMNDTASYLSNLDTDTEFNRLLEFGNALASDIRLKMLHFVNLVGSTCFCELERIFKIQKSTLNYHIKLLTKIGLLQTYKEGKLIVIKLGGQFETLLPDELKRSFPVKLGP